VGLNIAYNRMDLAEKLELAGDLDGAFAEQRAALDAFPDSPEIAFWTAVSLATRGQVDEARRLLEVPFAAYAGWVDLLRRLAEAGFIELSKETAARLLPDEA